MRMSFASIGVAAGLIVVGGGFSALWYQQADAGRAELARAISQANEHAHAGNGPLIRYDAISASGYPFRVTLTVKNPVVSLAMNDIIRSAAHHAGSAKSTAARWTEELRSNTVTVSHTIFPGSEVTVRLPDAVRSRSIVNNIVRQENITNANDGTCNFDLPQTLFTSNNRQQTGDFLRTNSHVSCRFAGVRTEDAHSHAQLVKTDEATLFWSNAASARDNRKMQIGVHVHGSRYFPAGDAAFRTLFRRAFAAYTGTTSDLRTLDPSAFGESNNDIDMSYDGPVPAARATSAQRSNTDGAGRNSGIPIRFDVDRFDQKNNLLSATFAMHAGTDGQGNAASDTFVAHSRVDISDAYTKLSRAVYLDNARHARDPQIALVERVSAAAVPDFHDLGSFTLDLDGSGNLTSAFKPDARDRTLTLRTFAIGVKPFGIELHGKGAQINNQQTTNFALTLRNADRLVDALGGYGRRVETALAPSKPVTIFTSGMVGSAREFVHAVAQDYDKTKPDAIVRFEQSPGSALMISGKDATQLFLLLRAIFPVPQSGSHTAIPGASI